MHRMAAAAIAIVTALLITGCASASSTTRASARTKPSLDEEIATAAPPVEALAWSASRRLSWADFRGTSPAAGADSALTAYRLLYGVRCDRNKLDMRVVAEFLPEKSWVRHNMLRQSDANRRALQHEQTHFDLSEVHARRMRKFFLTLYEPCGKRDPSLTTLAEGFVTQEASAQAQYDDETDHGRNVAEQTRWDASVQEMLASLNGFASSGLVEP